MRRRTRELRKCQMCELVSGSSAEGNEPPKSFTPAAAETSAKRERVVSHVLSLWTTAHFRTRLRRKITQLFQRQGKKEANQRRTFFLTDFLNVLSNVLKVKLPIFTAAVKLKEKRSSAARKRCRDPVCSERPSVLH